MLDKKTLERVFRQHYPKMIGIARALLYEPKAAEDAVFDVFAKLLECAPEVADEKLGAYLCVAVRNNCLNIIKKQKFAERFQKLYPIENEEIEDTDLELSERVAEYVENRIGEPQKSILKLRFADDLTFKQIAQRLQMNINTVYKYLTISINEIRQHLNNN